MYFSRISENEPIVSRLSDVSLIARLMCCSGLGVSAHHQGPVRARQQRLLRLLQLLHGRGLLPAAQHGPGRRHARLDVKHILHVCHQHHVCRHARHLRGRAAAVHGDIQRQSLRVLDDVKDI